MSNLDIPPDGLLGLDYDSRGYLQPQSWPVSVDQGAPPADGAREISPLQTSGHGFEQSVASDPNLMVDWQFQQLQPHYHYPIHGDPSASSPATLFATGRYGAPVSSPIDFSASAATHISTGLLDGSTYLPLSAPMDMTSFAFSDFQTGLMALPNGLPDMSSYPPQQNVLDSSSPTDTYLEVRSLTSSSSDNGWSAIEHRNSLDFSFPEQGMFINPSQTLHDRSLSDSSYSSSLGGSFVEISHPVHSPTSETNLEYAYGNDSIPRLISYDHASHGSISPTAVSPVAVTRAVPVPAKRSSSSTSSSASQSSSSASPPSRKPSRRSPMAAKTADTKVRKQSQSGKPETEKRIGKRKGPLKPDQRKQASEIRKLRACLRCKFLKKTCDKGEPCGGCQPSHARLWQVPCTRIDIKEIGYFMKDWKADYDRHVTVGFSVENIKGFSDHERLLFVTHGYGHVLPINAREVFVRDNQCFNMNWSEQWNQKPPNEYEIETAKLSAGMEGISPALLSDYLDRHIDGNGTFEKFVDDYFGGTPFLTQMLKTAFRYYFRTKLPVIRKALKLILAYNLTLHITMVEGTGEEDRFLGRIDDPSSKFHGKTLAPVMISFQIKCAMASMWRELQKDVLEELSALYSSVYSGEKLKNWPTIFILASVLLAVWEEMQFDCHYRVPNPEAVEKFCNDMESTPVGVIIGLFQAISQKLPAFTEWETQKHHHLLNSNPDVCNTMTEVRQHVTKYESYLRTRSSSKFDHRDFDCLSNKFLSRLVIRAN
ncbi:hypothetical protein MPDQ_000400 [Monascus purpureus]|uniref:Zn(2)-C6 fungal-type domain-containing protein n=1 Tax=Monascus purpureus TaxID=5098 RepID=A0A507QTC0_MONPU|nr:hypothetical protein MPDQ_000400 [Monascus purpureus]BDD58309.1 hypothetical protein MAP00_003599 [Monascus purpureus]